MKTPLIEFLEYNFLLSILDYFNKEFQEIQINGNTLKVFQSNRDPHFKYVNPALAIEIMYRRAKSVGFNNYLGTEEDINTDTEIEGTLFEYRVQLNVYSNTRGENYKWCSLLDEVLKLGESNIPLNIYNDDATIKYANIAEIAYDYSKDVRNNSMPPNIMTYDFHTIYEWKVEVLQEYKEQFELMLGYDLKGNLKNKFN